MEQIEKLAKNTGGKEIKTSKVKKITSLLYTDCNESPFAAVKCVVKTFDLFPQHRFRPGLMFSGFCGFPQKLKRTFR